MHLFRPVCVIAPVFGVFFVLVAGSAPAQANACRDKAASAPKIRLNVEFRSPSLQTNLSRKQLRSRGGGSAHLMGKTEVKRSYRMEMGIRYTKSPNGKGVCFEPTIVKVDIASDPVRIFLASELKTGSCAYRVTLDHEKRHVAIERKALNRHTADLRGELKRALPKHMQWAKSKNHAIEKNRDVLKRVLERTMAAVANEARNRHGEMDTPAAYRAETKKCNDWPS